MATKQTIFTVTATHGGETYTATLDKSRRTDDGTWSVTVESSDGLRGDGGWDGGIWGISNGGEGEIPGEAIALLDKMMTAALRAR